MFRFAFFACTCCAILMGFGFLPKPTSENLPEFAIPEIALPEQPALLAEIGELSIDLPEMGKRFEEKLTSLIPRPSTETKPVSQAKPVARTRPAVDVPQLQVIAENTDVAVPVPTPIADVVTFDLNDTELDQKAKAQLNDFAVWLASNPQPKVHIFGHTDLTGPEEYNDQLGQSRADQVATYLIAKGVAPERISVVVSYGESKPLVVTEETSRENRRVKVATAL